MFSDLALVVDDEPAVRELLCRYMETAGFTPLPQADGPAALDLLLNQYDDPPALVVTDINMPGMTGVDLVRRLRAKWPTLPALFVTGRDGLVAGAGTLGEVVLKPFELDAFFAATRRVLLASVLETAIRTTHADMGNVQTVDSAAGALRIVAQHGFERPFLSFFQSTGAGDAACGRAVQDGRRVVVEDVRTSGLYGDDSRKAMVEASALSVQSTPIISREHQVLGVLSTHYHTPHRFEPDELRPLDEIAQRTGRLLERLG